jgi:hypothetical protein
MYQSILKISVMLLLVGNSISFGMIITNQDNKKQLQKTSVGQEPIYPMTIDEVLKLVEEDKKLKLNMIIVPKVSLALNNSDKEYLRGLFASVEVMQDIDSKQRPLFKNVMIAMAKKDYDNLSQSLLDLKQSMQAIASPKLRLSLSYEMYSRATRDRNSFELVTKADPFAANNLLVENRAAGRHLTLLDKMIEDPTFHHKNIKIYKDNGGITAEEHGRLNLETLYKNQDPQFVLNFLRSHYVPVILIAMTPVFIEEDKTIEFLIVSPYRKNFYTNPDMQFINNEKEIEELGKKRLDSARRAFFDKRLKQNPVEAKFKGTGFKDPLMNAALFGNDEDVAKELENDPKHLDIVRSIIASIGSPNKKNNALECLLLQLKLLRQQGNVSMDAFSYLFLSLSTNNKEAFELISHIDPYKCNMVKWRYSNESEGQSRTNLDRMIKDKNFSSENIRVFREHYGMTTEELHNVSSIGDILKELPQRNIELTPDEEIHMRRLSKLSFSKT